MLSPIKKTIIELGNGGKPLPNSRLIELSNLSSEELEFLKRSWPAIESKRRHQTVHRLVELTEDNLELNFDAILRYCMEDQDEEVRSKAVEGLWENEEASLIDPLINLLKQDRSEKVQIAAATALGKFAMLAEYKKLRSCHISKIQEALLDVLNDKNKPIAVKCHALEAAAPVSLPQVKKIIMEAYQSHDSRFRVSSIYAMGRSCDPAWLPILLKELANADAELRYEATGACGELEEEAAVPHLAKLINDPDVDVQMTTIQALGKIGGTIAKECLECCLDSASEAIRQAAEQALLELETKVDQLPFRL